MYYKVESYIGSEQAGKILYENDLTPVYVSDNPVLNAQHVVFEAAKGYRYGLPYHAALASVTSAPAELLGMGERIGKVKEGFDADIVVWDSDPLSVGATPVQIWIDGTAQYEDPIVLEKPLSDPIIPDEELNAKIPEEGSIKSNIILTGISQVMIPGSEQTFGKDETPANVVVQQGKIICVGLCEVEMSAASSADTPMVDLRNGYLSPSFTSFGSGIGLSEIASESDTQNGADTSDVFSRAIDGLQLEGKNLKASYAHGVTKAISAPESKGGGQMGVSVGFLTGASTALEKDAIWAEEVSVHYTFTLAAKQDKTPSISSGIGAFREKLLKAVTTNETITDIYSEPAYLKKVVSGEVPLTITVNSADTIAALLRVKAEVETAIKASSIVQSVNSGKIRLVLLGGAEAHLLAGEIAAADVSVVVAPLLPYSNSWDQRRSLTGAPLTNGTTIDVLIDAGVLTAIGTTDGELWEARNLNLMAGIAFKNSGGRLSETDALALISKNLETMLGIESPDARGEFVVFEGSPLEIASRVKVVGSQGRVAVY